MLPISITLISITAEDVYGSKKTFIFNKIIGFAEAVLWGPQQLLISSETQVYMLVSGLRF